MPLKNTGIFLLSLITISTMQMLNAFSSDPDEHEAQEARWFNPQKFFPFFKNEHLNEEPPLAAPIVVAMALPLALPLVQQKVSNSMNTPEDEKLSGIPLTRAKRKRELNSPLDKEIEAAHVAIRKFIDGEITYKELDRVVKKAMGSRTAMVDQ
jgi:hypothetical protein